MGSSSYENLVRLYGVALSAGLCKGKTDFAKLINMDPASISHAFANNGKIRIENVVKKTEDALTRAGIDITTGDNSTTIAGSNNSVGVPAKNFTHESEWFALVSEKDKQIDRLLGIIEKMQK